MLKDFYYSETYEQSQENRISRSFEKETLITKEVLINGKFEKFSFQVNAGTKHNVIWEDTIYIGTEDNSNCRYGKK